MNLEKYRSKPNTIFKLTNSNTNKTITSCDDILAEVAVHFSSLYNSRDQNLVSESMYDHIFLDKDTSILSENEDNSFLNINISENEILSALKRSKNGSSPGLDGLPSEIYKFFWNDIKKPLINCFNYSYHTGSLSDSQRQGVICLLHKGKGCKREEITSWRPISLTNFDYKLLAKTLAIRLVQYLDTCIDMDLYKRKISKLYAKRNR